MDIGISEQWQKFFIKSLMDDDVQTDEETRQAGHGICIYDLEYALEFIETNGDNSYVNINRI